MRIFPVIWLLGGCLVLFAGCRASVPQDAPAGRYYYRFWRGFKKPDLSAEAFRDGLNRTFIPGTVAQGKGRGLLAYLPVIVTDQRPCPLPDEFALLAWESEARYRANRETAEGKAYGELHWEYFEKGVSASRVPAPYQGTVAFGTAYDLLGGNPDWQKGEAIFFQAARREGIGDAEYLSGVKRYLDRAREGFPGQGLVVLVEPEYVAGYVLGQGPRGDSGALLERVTVPCQQHPLSRGIFPLDGGQGLNAEF